MRLHPVLVFGAALAAILLTSGCGKKDDPPGHQPPPSTTMALVTDNTPYAATGVVEFEDLSSASGPTRSKLETGSGSGQFNRPIHACVDGSGRIIVADTSNHRIIRMNSIAGGGWVAFGSHGTGTGQFAFPSSVACDRAGHIYVADSSNARIVRIDDMSGSGWTTCTGDGTHTFSYPISLQLDGGHLYVGDDFLDQVIRIDDLAGAGWTAYGANGSGTGQFNGVEQIAIDSSHRIYIADRVNARIVRIDDLTGAGWTEMSGDGGSNTLFAPAGLAVDPDGHIYISYNLHLSRCDDMSGANWMNYTYAFGEPGYITIIPSAMPTGIASHRGAGSSAALALVQPFGR